MMGLQANGAIPVAGRIRPRHRGADARFCRRLGGVVAIAFGVTAAEVLAPSRGKAPVAFARQTAIYLGHVVFGLSLTRLAQGFGRDRTTAGHACRTIEEWREDPAIDQVFGLLEAACCEALAGARNAPGMRP